MRTQIIFLMVVCLSTMSCSYEGNRLILPSTDIKSEIISKLQGNYSSCAASQEYPGYYESNTLSVVGTTYSFSSTLSGSATCSTYYNTIVNTYEINNASYINASANTEDIQLEFKVKYVGIKFNDNYYISQNYCGLNNWALNVEKDVTGLPCANLLSGYDSFHTSFKAVDALEYVDIKRTSTSIWHPTANSESGDTALDSLKGLLAEMPSY